MPRPDQEFKGKFWADRGIAPEVARERGYLRYEKHDISTVKGHFAGLSPGQKATVTRKAQAEHGLAIVRFPVLDDLEKPIPELRPDVAISTETPRSHWHGFGEPPEHGTHYRKLDPTSKAGLDHRWKWHTPPEGQVIPENEVARERGEEPGNTEVVHETRSSGKYHFAPTGYVKVEKTHDHDEQYKPPKTPHKPGKYSNYLSPEERRARHVAKHHGGLDVAGEHKHVWKIKNPDEDHARRLDIHPWASERLEAARLVYFGIEGCLKADAILSAILKEVRPESVFSVPSVSLWEAPELPQFIERRLVGKVVIIVLDSDWIKKHQVMEQARMCRTYLRRHGLEAHVAAPPTDRLAEGIKGVDDYLGQGGGTLDGLMVQDREVDECKHLDYLDRCRIGALGAAVEEPRRGFGFLISTLQRR
jgi:hypothetical protein